MQTTPSSPLSDRASMLLQQHQFQLWRQTDRLFAALLVVQWLAGIAVAAWLSPLTWNGMDSRIHPHVWGAIVLGGLIAAGPLALVVTRPGELLTRLVVSAAQVLHSAMLIHLSGGRIETHFHVFGSLAFLSFYRDWRVLVPATLIVAVDHAARGIFWPESVFGIADASAWRWLEHAGWVIFEDIFLIWSCIRGASELRMLAMRQAELETVNRRIEAEVARQTARLESVSQELVGTARRAGMAEIATGVLHNVGNVLNSVNVSVAVALRQLKESEVQNLVTVGQMLRGAQNDLSGFLTSDPRGRHVPAFVIEAADCLGKQHEGLLQELQSVATGLDHIKNIVSAQQQHAKNGNLREKVAPSELFERAIAMDLGSTSDQRIEIVRDFADVSAVAMDKHKVLQILINLLSNAKRAVSENAQRLIHVTICTRETGQERRIRFEVQDNGVGIHPDHLARIFSHGFTTRAEGHGFGLHSAANAAREMGGDLSVHSDGPGLGATFALELPMEALTATEELFANKKGNVCLTK
jgi:signal transduction histidine kinase